MPNVRKSDIDRLRERLKEGVGRYPGLQMLLDGLPDDYDPAGAPLELSADPPEPDDEDADPS